MRRHMHGDFRVDGLSDFHYCGISGGKLNKNEHVNRFRAAINRYQPKGLIVQIGGNDLDSCVDEDDAELLVLRLVSVCRLFKCKVDNIYINQFMPRNAPRYSSASDYNARVITANRRLKEELAGETRMFYWKLKGFNDPLCEVFCDGVHLNTAGMRKYFRHIRGAILHSLQN